MGGDLLRIGEIASRAGVSRRTVDFYTGLGLLTPLRSGGNFRLYQPGDAQRITTIRRLETHGLRLEEITRLLTDRTGEGDTGRADPDPADRSEDHDPRPDPTDPVALAEYLTSLDAQVQALRDLPEVADQGTRGVLTSLVVRAQVLIATALVLREELLPGTELLPPF
jgi:MerR family transcriptional regulator, copper efflux regulator